MYVAELMTLLKQYEATNPGRDVAVQIAFEAWDEEQKRTVKRTGTVGVRDFRWGPQGAVVVAEVLT